MVDTLGVTSPTAYIEMIAAVANVQINREEKWRCWTKSTHASELLIYLGMDLTAPTNSNGSTMRCEIFKISFIPVKT